MFDRYHHSWAVVIPVKYECDIIEYVSGVLMILKIWENNGIEKIGLVPPPLNNNTSQVNLTFESLY